MTTSIMGVVGILGIVALTAGGATAALPYVAWTGAVIVAQVLQTLWTVSRH